MKKKTHVMRIKVDVKSISVALALRHAAAELERQAAMLRSKADLIEGGSNAKAKAAAKPKARKAAKRRAAKVARKVTKKTARKVAKKAKPLTR